MIVAALVVTVLFLLVIRTPVAVALLVPTIGYVLLTPEITLGVAVQRMVSGVDLFALLAIPFFVLAGYAATAAGVVERLVNVAQAVLRPVPGSLGYVNVSTGVVFSWMSGNATADAAGMGSTLTPAMRRRGYSDSFAAGLTGAAASIGAIMPPSVSAIIYAVTAGVSIGGLFIAGVVPALLIAASLAFTVFLHSRSHAEHKPPAVPSREIAKQGVTVIPVMFAPVIVIGGILGGIFTPTEAAAVTVIYVLSLGLLYRHLTPAGLTEAFRKAAQTTAQILIIVASAALFGWVLTREEVPAQVADWAAGLTNSPVVLLLVINVTLLVIGMFIEPTAALLIMVPVLLPAAEAVGIDPMHLGAVMVLNLTIGLITPPIGLIVYILASVTGVRFSEVSKGCLRMLVPLLIVLLLLTLFPNIALWLPTVVGLR